MSTLGFCVCKIGEDSHTNSKTLWQSYFPEEHCFFLSSMLISNDLKIISLKSQEYSVIFGFIFGC